MIRMEFHDLLGFISLLVFGVCAVERRTRGRLAESL